jgi:hypothetical protein
VTDDDLRCFLRTCLEGFGVAPPPDADLPVALLRTVLERLRALDAVEAEGEEPLPLPWTQGWPWTSSA